MPDCLKKLGYSMEDFNQRQQWPLEVKGATTFTIPLEYSLADDKLEVCIPTAGIEETARNHQHSLLQFMGAGGLDEEGYILVPNGAGSYQIQRQENRKGTTNTYTDR